jgi:hypothetical protein
MSALITTIQKTAAVQLRVSLEQFKGHDLCDVREFASFTAANVPMPTRKGVSVPVRLLPDLIVALQAAEAQARSDGLLGGDA